MANAIAKIYLHIILAPHGEECLIPDQYKRQIELYTKGILSKNEHVLHAVKVLDDHMHLLIQYNPNQTLPVLIHELKNSLEGYMNANQWFDILFEWQPGYAVFSSAQSQVEEVSKFIQNQNEHHQKHSFENEYKGFLKRFEVDVDKEEMFEFYGQ